jgi:hypothetical protein
MRQVWLLIWVLGAALAPGWATAQVTMEVQLGLQGTVRLEKWNPVTVQVRNTGAPLVGTLGVRVWRGSEFRKDQHATIFTLEVELPHRSQKRYTFVVPITSIAHPVEVFLRRGAQEMVHKRLNLRQALNAEHLLLGVTTDPDLDFLATAFQRHTRVVYLHPRRLPQRWDGYDTVSAVVLKGVSLQAISARQMTALRQWIARGGTFVVAGDSQYGLLQEPRVRELLPVQVLGVEQRQGLPMLAQRYGKPLADVPLLAIRSRLVRGQALIRTPSAPLLAQRPFGKGRVVFLGVDYATQPLAGWAGNKALWRDILQPSEQVDFSRVFAELGLLDEAHPIAKLLRRPLLTYPSHLALSLFLLAYCGGLGLLFWRMSKPRVHRRGYWLGMVGFVLAAVGVAYGGFPEWNLRRSALLIDVSTMEILPETGYSLMHGYVGLFSPRGGRYTLALRYPDSILRHTFHRGTGHAGQTIEVTSDGDFTMRGITLAPWMLRVFSIESMTSAPLLVQAWQHSSGITVQVTNRHTQPLQGAVVVYRGKLFSLGTVPPGQELFEDLYAALQPRESRHETVWQALFKRRPVDRDDRLTYLQEVLLQRYFGEQRLTEWSEAPLLAGWFMGPSTLRQTPETSSIQGMTLVVSRLSG